MTAETLGRKIRILIADDHPMLREGVAAVIQFQPDMELVGEAETGAAAIECFRRLRPDVTLMDLQMPELNGVEAIMAIRAEFPKARIVVLTTYSGDVQALRALKAGAAGYLLKSSLRKDLLETIRNVHLGQRQLQSEVANEIALHAVDDPLTDREARVLQLIATGRANKQIAWELGVSEETIKAHLKNIFEKLDVGDRTHAVTVAAKRGIIEL
jgi:DNA-binding NarL/FixJ family response regulator